MQSDPFAYRSFNEFFTRALEPGCATDRRRSDAHREPRRRHGQPVRRARWTTAAPGEGTSLFARGTAGRRRQDRARVSRRQLRLHLSRAVQLSPHPHAVRRRRCAAICMCRATVQRERGDRARRAAGLRAQRAPDLRLRYCHWAAWRSILVGALFVGSIETVHCGEVNPPPRRRKAPRADRQRASADKFAKGEELGRFNMGSTVVLLFRAQPRSRGSSARPGGDSASWAAPSGDRAMNDLATDGVRSRRSKCGRRCCARPANISPQRARWKSRRRRSARRR